MDGFDFIIFGIVFRGMGLNWFFLLFEFFVWYFVGLVVFGKVLIYGERLFFIGLIIVDLLNFRLYLWYEGYFGFEVFNLVFDI